jgi:integrase
MEDGVTRILEVLPQFEREAQGERIGPGTMRRYQRILRAFARWLDPDAAVGDIDAGFIRAYAGELVRAGRAPRTIRLTLSAIRAFCRWAIRAGLRADDPTLAVVWPKIPKSLPRPLSRDELQRLADVLDEPVSGRGRDPWQWDRNVRAIGLMIYAGLRLGEACRLTWEQIDLGRGVLYVVQSKGRKDRVVPIHPVLAALLADVPVSQRRGPVCPSRSGSQQGPSAMAHLCQRWLPGLGLTGITAHRLRYTCATELRRARADLKDIQAILGHESLETTDIYLGPDPEQLRDAINRLPALRQMGGRRRRRLDGRDGEGVA